jgi:ABC-2 type transport system ATP-binding protein
MGGNMIKLDNVSKTLGGFALKDISFELPAGCICGLIGENGAGKTTLLHILAGLYSYDSGEVNILGKNFTVNEYELKQDIGVQLHGDLFDVNSTLLVNARRYGSFYKNYDYEELRKYLSRFNLDEKRKYKALSTGEKLKFAFAFALSLNPRLLLLDEPGASFDADFRKEFHKILREFTSDGTRSVILSTHITSDVEAFADYILFLKKGRQLMFGDIETVRGNYRMVSGEAYKIRLMKDRVIYMEEGQLGCKALVVNRPHVYDKELTVWEPSIDELMYYMVKGDKNEYL